GVAKPIAAARMMIGIKTIGLVSDGQTELHHMPRHRRRHRASGNSITTGLESIPIAARAAEIRPVAVVKRPAMIEAHRLKRIDAIITVIAVEPRAAAVEHIAPPARRRMT